MPAPPIKAEVHGVVEFERGARRLFQNIDTAADANFRTVADQAAVLVRGRVPHQTGRLAASLAGTSSHDGATVGYGEVVYAGPVDYGGWPPGRPFIPQGRYLYPTALETVSVLKRAGQVAAANEIRKMLWPKPMGLGL